jgi:HSP20 family protein
VSKKEEKEIEAKAPEEKAMEPWYPSDVLEAFDEMWTDYRRGFMRPWRSWRFWNWNTPWRTMMQTPTRMLREAYVDFIDTGTEFQVCAEVPGTPKDKIDVTITKNGIEIAGKATVERHDALARFIQERGYSEIYRQLAFPEEVIPDKATATLKDGLLEITIPKKTPTPKTMKHKVEIE